MASVATYGGFDFADNEVNLVTLSKQTRYSSRNRRMQRIATLTCEGELIYSDTATIITHIQSAESALSQDGRDFRYTVGGTLAHSLLNAGSASGVKVLHYSFPKGDPAQLSTTRTFRFTLQATYDDVEDDLVSWTDTVSIQGTGGPKFFIVDTVTVPVAILVSTNSAVYYTRTGAAVGYTDYPVAPGPPTVGLEFGWRRNVARTSGRQTGSGIRFFTTRWSYYTGNDPATFGNFDAFPESR